MPLPRKVAVVTGVDNGAGLEIVRGLCTQFDGDVVVTALKTDHQMITDLKHEGLRPHFHQLDSTDQASVDRLKVFLQENYGGLDVLVHNSAVVKFPKHFRFSYRVKNTMKCNFFGSLSLCRSLWKLLKPHSRVCVVVATKIKSAFSQCSLDLQSELRSEKLSMGHLELLMEEFVWDSQKGAHFRKGWPSDEFAVSQLAAALMAAILNRQAVDDYRGDIAVTACWPGHASTDIGCCHIPLTSDRSCLPW